MFVQPRMLVGIALTSLAVLSAQRSDAQTRTVQACSQGPLKNCASIRLTSQLGAGPGNTNQFSIGIANLGSTSTPALATSIYFATFLTGLAPAAIEVDATPAPVAIGGATVSNASPWSIAESGDAIFLSSPGNSGIGGCATSTPVNGFGQMARTCGTGQLVSFSFFTSRVIDVNAVTLADLEFVAIAGNNVADSCNADAPCTISGAAVVTPEPASLLLSLFGLVAIAGIALRRSIALRPPARRTSTIFLTEA